MSNDCFLDLQRAAMALYLNPQGRTHLVFLNHAEKIADQGESVVISKLRTNSTAKLSVGEASRLADQILTAGLMLKKS